MAYPYEDQVPRLKAFQATHPDIDIDNPIDSRSAFWTARRGGEVLASKRELHQLLDTLERLLEPGGRPPPA